VEQNEVTPPGTARIIVTNPQNREKYFVEIVVVTGKLTPLIGARAAQHIKLLTIQWNYFKSVPAPKRNEGVADSAASSHAIPESFSRASSDLSQAW